jgi:zeaxanthin glucosyltransferase
VNTEFEAAAFTVMFMPHPEYGHINPTLKLAKDLKNSGLRIGYIGLADSEDYIREQGFEFISILRKQYPRGYRDQHTVEMQAGGLDTLDLVVSGAAGRQGGISFDLFGEIEADFRRIGERIKIDLLILDFKLKDLRSVTANRLRIPTAILSVTLIDLKPMEQHRVRARDTSREAPELFLCPEEFDFPSSIRDHRYYIEPCVDVTR